MRNVALYRKYRPRSLVDVVGQGHISDTLTNALKNKHISHAYLFSGPKGVGKTSVARILAHEINNLTYSDDIHLDIIEIDAASNRRIDEIRNLRDKVSSAPTSAAYKVYIIDEVHMLTKEAFNALLKTLEEPPSHVVFILATTEVHKLPATIVSRTQRHSFRRINDKEAASHLRKIATAENISITDDALNLIADQGDGSFRDSISLLDQVSNVGDTEITGRLVRDTLGLPQAEWIEELLIALNSSTQSVLTTLDSLYDSGVTPVIIAQQLLRQLLDREVINEHMPDRLPLMKALSTVQSHPNPTIALELALLSHSKYAKPATSPNTKIQHQQSASASDKPSTPKKNKDLPAPTTDTQPVKTAQEDKKVHSFDEKIWVDVLEHVRENNPSLYAMLRIAKPQVANETELELSFAFPFHKRRVDEARSKGIVTKQLQTLTGKDFTITCLVDATLIDAPPLPPSRASQDVDESTLHVMELMGGELVDETGF